MTFARDDREGLAAITGLGEGQRDGSRFARTLRVPGRCYANIQPLPGMPVDVIAVGAPAASDGRPRSQSTSPLTVRGTDVSSALVQPAFCALAENCQCSSIWCMPRGSAWPSGQSADRLRLKRSGKSAEFAHPSGTV